MTDTSLLEYIPAAKSAEGGIMANAHADWIAVRRLLWDDGEGLLIASGVKSTKPIKPASDYTQQPVAQYATFNGIRPGTQRNKGSLCRFHTWVVEFDHEPLDEQRERWAKSDLPHTLRVFSGNKSIHLWIRTAEDVTAGQWESTAEALHQAFPGADPRVLKNPAAFVRTPGGMREDKSVLQSVEYLGGRIPFTDLQEWLHRGGGHSAIVPKSHSDIGHSSIVTKKNSLCVFPASAGDITLKIRRMERAEAEYKAQPAMDRLYGQLVSRKWQPESGKRNAHLVEIVPFLFTAVCRDVAMDFAKHFYELNQIHYDDPLDQHIAEAEHLWDSINSEYPSRLPDQAMQFYVGFNSPELTSARKQVFFRIARALALDVEPKNKKGLEQGIFCAPQHAWAVRLMCNKSDVEEIIGRFQNMGIIRTSRKGRQNRMENGKIISGEATAYEWLLG
jgi:hypothetical protein